MKALIALAVLASLSCASAQPRKRPPLGYTTCAQLETGEVFPLAWIRLDALASPEGPAIVAHEAIHAAVMQRFPDCKAYRKWSAEGDNAMREEALAFCAMTEWAMGTGRFTASEALLHYGRWLSAGYPQFKLDLPGAVEVIREACL